MLSFTKEKEYLVCIDSDGTIMDTMTVKHVNCFGPEFINVYQIKEHVEDILTEWNRANLYSLTRGINRFQGLKEILVYVKKYGYEFEGSDEFFYWVDTTKEFSVNSIKEFMKTASNTNCFELALEWSKRVNESIEKLPPSLAFNGVSEVLHSIVDKVDLVGVSSANEAAVVEEWTRLNLISLFKEVACQNKGNKAHIISESLKQGYKKENTIMLGDALGDLNAATKNGVWFFPIVPGKEETSWVRFYNEALVKLLNNQFDQNYQDQLIKEFNEELK